MAWKVFLTQEAEQRLLAVKDRRIRKLLYSSAIKLDYEVYNQLLLKAK